MNDPRTNPDQRMVPRACAVEVDALCDAFERQWKAGERPDIDAYLERADPSWRGDLLRELVVLEITYRRQAGEHAAWQDYQRRFPAFLDPLQEAWQLLSASAKEAPAAPAAGHVGGMPAHSSDLNLLFGVLALQMGFVTRDALLSGMNAWMLRRDAALASILLDAGALGAEECGLLQALVDKHLERHGGDAQQSLAALSPVGPLRAEMQQLADADLAQSLVHLAVGRPAVDPHATMNELPADMQPPGRRFRILRPHAQGGLGCVSVAHDEELHREVALKEIRREIAHDAHLRTRFIVEAEITGGLEHPGIVPVYGLGQYDDGRPFYAMRFIRGDSLKEAVDRFHRGQGDWQDPARRLELRQLLGRFVDVCQAMEYAHSRGVLHRDLKPGNIMLGKYGETLVVDWGLAKAQGREALTSVPEESVLRLSAGSHSEPTVQGAAVGTPAYMSPEQAAGKTELLGRATDVYGLGATLFHLLTGQPPLSGKDIPELLRRVQQGDVPSPRELNPRVPRVLSAICRRAMALVPQDRYASAAALADDVERYLADEPVTAYRERSVERASRWFRKHRTAALYAAAALLLVALVSGIATLIIAGQNRHIRLLADNERVARVEADRQRLEADRARDDEKLARTKAEKLARDNQLLADEKTRLADEKGQLADEKSRLAAEKTREAEKANRLTEFLVGSFEAADPLGISGIPLFVPHAAGEVMTVRDVLQRGHDRVDRELASEPEVQAAVKNTIGNVYRSLGFLKEAEPLLVSALEQRQAILPKNHLDVAQSCHDLAWLYHERGDFRRAEELYREALAIRQQHGAEAELLVAASMQNLGWLLGQDERDEEARDLLQKTLEIRTRLLGGQHRDTAVANIGMAFCLIEADRKLEAVPYFMKAQAAILSGNQDSKVNQAIIKSLQGLLADNVLGLGLERAESLLAEAQQLTQEALGEDYLYVGVIAFERARRMDELGKDAEAEKLYQTALAFAREKVQLQHPRIRLLVEEYGNFLIRHDRAAEARSLWDEFLNVQKERFGEDNPIYAEALAAYATAQNAQEDAAGEEQTLRTVMRIFEQTNQQKRVAYLLAANNLALLLIRKGDELEYAEQLLRDVIKGALPKFGETSRQIGDIQINLARVLLKREKFSEAESALQTAELIGNGLTGKDRQELLDWLFWWRSRLYYKQQRPLETVQAIQNMAALWPGNADELYVAAAEFAACLALPFEGDAAAAEQERIAQLALATLAQAIDAGYKDADKLHSDKRWERVRERPEFQQQLSRIPAAKQ